MDLPRTVACTAMWGGNSWIRTAPGEAWFARRTPEGPATVHLIQRDTRVDARAWGPGRDWLLNEVPALVGLDDEPWTLTPIHPGLKRALRAHPGLRLGRTGMVFEATLRAAMTAGAGKREGKEAIWRMASAWGEAAPGPRSDLRLLPTADALSSQPYATFHRLGIARKRAELAVRLAKRHRYLGQAATLPREAVASHLQALRGIGPWVTGVVRLTALGDPDAVPIGDPNLPRIVAFGLVGEAQATGDRMLDLLKPYEGQRGRVARMMKSVGPSVPRRGPKVDRRDFRDW